jgi:hypothetical protein
MQFSIFIYQHEHSVVNKKLLYNMTFEYKIKNHDIVKSKDFTPTIIDAALSTILNTNIPEELQDIMVSNKYLEFCIIGDGINIQFDLKEKT